MMDKNIGVSADGFQNIIIWIIVIGEIQKAISFLINIPGNEMKIFICFSHLTEYVSCSTTLMLTRIRSHAAPLIKNVIKGLSPTVNCRVLGLPRCF